MDIAQSSIVVQYRLRTSSYCMQCLTNGPLFALSSTQLQTYISKTLKKKKRLYHKVRPSLKPNRVHWYRHAGGPAVKNSLINPGTFSFHPSPGSLGFAQFLPQGAFGNCTDLSQADFIFFNSLYLILRNF